MSSAVIIGDHRYVLVRELGGVGPRVLFTLVNPSTAGPLMNDHTVRKGLGFSRSWGASRMTYVNKFAFRSKDVEDLATAIDPVGPLNDAWILSAMMDADIVVAAWGPLAKLPPRLRGRWREVCSLADTAGKPLMCLGVAKDGQPRHPLMLSYSTPIVPWTRPQ